MNFNVFRKKIEKPTEKPIVKKSVALSNDDILKIIDIEIKKSEEEFGLKILKKDQEIEKEVVLRVFNKYSHLIKKANEYSSREYTEILSDLRNLIMEELEPQLRYYFATTPPRQVKNGYNCHLIAVVQSIFFKYVY